MNYGLYMAASGMFTQMARLEVASNNLANINTVAYKPDAIGVQQRDPVTIEDGLPFEDSNRMLERLGAGPWPTRTETHFAPGALEKTDRPLDVGMQSDGFMALQRGGPDDIVYTRDGRLTIHDRGVLVNASTGHPVLSEGGGLLRLDTSQRVTIHTDGRIEQDNGVIGQIRVRGISEPLRLEKQGENLFSLDAGAAGAGAFERVVPVTMEQGYLESSGVNAVRTTLTVTSASRSVRSAGRIISRA